MESESISIKENKNDNSNNNKNNNKPIILSRKVRWFLLIFFCFLNGVLTINGGVFSAAVTKIKNDLNINDEEFGLLGTTGGIGNFLGALVFTFLISCLNSKVFLILCLFFNVFGNFLVLISNNFIILLIGRFISGIQTVCLFLYFPVWINQFSIQRFKALFMTIFQSTGTISLIWGYLVNLIVGPEKWRHGFLIEIGLECLSLFIILFIPYQYCDKELFFFKHGNENSNNKEVGEKDSERLESIFSPEKKEDKTNSDESGKKETIMSGVICNSLLIFITAFRSVQCFIAFALTYWYTDYVEDELKISNSKAVFVSYTISSITSGFIGVTIGGCIYTCFGEKSAKIHPMIIGTFHLIATVICLFVPYVKTIEFFTILMFLFNVFSYMTTPFEIAITFDIVPKKMAGVANGLLGIFMNITAFLPAPIVYGTIKANFGSNVAMDIMAKYNLVGGFFIIISICLQIRKNRKIEEKENNGIMLKDIETNK